MWGIKGTDIAIVFATLFGPICAVQAQAALERRRERFRRRYWIFRTLMATRATILSPSHVEALNAIPVEFYGKKPIVRAWQVYLDHLADTESDPKGWVSKRVDLFVVLLQKLATSLRYDFSEVELKKEVYTPRAHGEVENEEQIIRRGVAALLKGDYALPMAVQSWPVDPEALAAQKEIQKHLVSWLSGQSVPRVRIEGANAPPTRAEGSDPSL